VKETVPYYVFYPPSVGDDVDPDDGDGGNGIDLVLRKHLFYK